MALYRYISLHLLFTYPVSSSCESNSRTHRSVCWLASVCKSYIYASVYLNVPWISIKLRTIFRNYRTFLPCCSEPRQTKKFIEIPSPYNLVTISHSSHKIKVKILLLRFLDLFSRHKQAVSPANRFIHNILFVSNLNIILLEIARI